MVDLVVLSDPYILVAEWFAYFTIWRYNKDIVVFGQTKTIVAFLKDYFGFHHDCLALVAVVLIAFPIFFASLFAYFIGRLNFQRR